MYDGRLGDASRILEEEIAATPPARSTINTARLIVTLAEVRVIQARNADAIKLAEQALETNPAQNISLLAGRVFILAGKPARGLEIAADLGRKLDREAQMYAKLLTAEADLNKGDARAAVGDFTDALKFSDSWIGRYGLGRAYLAAEVYTDAQTEFDACFSRKGEATTMLLDDIPTYRYMAWATFYKGRAQEGQGSPTATAAAVESYKSFLAIKEKGDEQGMVADARRRVAALQ
jgi:tetratricopeptide (TPR) repeat protein